MENTLGAAQLGRGMWGGFGMCLTFDSAHLAICGYRLMHKCRQVQRCRSGRQQLNGK